MHGLGARLPGVVLELGRDLTGRLDLVVLVLVRAVRDAHGLEGCLFEAVFAAHVDARLIHVEERTFEQFLPFFFLALFLRFRARQAVFLLEATHRRPQVTAVADPR